MFTVVRYLPIPRDFTPHEPARRDGFRRDPLLDLSLLRIVLNPLTTPEEERVLRRLRALRAPEPRPAICQA